MKEAQQVVAEKTSSLEAEAYKTKRLQVYFILNMNVCFYINFSLFCRLGRNCTTTSQGGTHEEDGIGGNIIGRGDDGRNPRIQGNVDVSIVQSETKGRGAVEVFPRILLGLFAYTLRNETA